MNSLIPEPMLAVPYDAEKVKNEKLFVQPKLDGIRALVTEGPIFYTRKGNVLHFLDHLFTEIDRFKDLLDIGFLDGELYNPKLDFEEIVSLTKRKNEMHSEVKQIKYFIFDFCNYKEPRSSFLQRINEVHSIFAKYKKWKYVFLVETLYFERENLEDFYQYFHDYEGLIIRTNWPYQHKRTYALMKYKKFQDNEFLVKDIFPGQGKHKDMGIFLLEGQDNEGNPFDFRAPFKGSDAMKKELLKNKKKYIGKLATLKFQELTKRGVPRFGIITSIRDYE